jgi:8-oxo-dGTP pyrophosphatase MutT (NUDIX family)
VRVQAGIGMIGVQYLIFSPCQRYILVGKRSLTQSYYPGRSTVPGGMLELEDVYLSPKVAMLRELNEEVPISIDSTANVIAILVGWNFVSVTFLIKTMMAKNYDFNPLDSIISEKSEWDGDLRWISLTDLKNLANNQVLDGLLYYKSII